MEKLLRHFDISPNVQAIFGFFKLAGLIIFFGHLIACLWHGITLIEDPNWITVCKFK
jgi:hypothetical protein